MCTDGEREFEALRAIGDQQPSLSVSLEKGVSTVKRLCFHITIPVFLFVGMTVLNALAGPLVKPCVMQVPCGPSTDRQRPSNPECGLELTCTNKPVILGYTQGVCFRATCPGVWGLLHERMDQSSFRRRLFAYRHYTFRGYWELKDQGLIEAGAVKQRELFLVLPEDLIEFRLLDSDPLAGIALRNLGYIKNGSIDELQRWLAFERYLERAEETLTRP